MEREYKQAYDNSGQRCMFVKSVSNGKRTNFFISNSVFEEFQDEDERNGKVFDTWRTTYPAKSKTDLQEVFLGFVKMYMDGWNFRSAHMVRNRKTGEVSAHVIFY